MYRYLPQHHTRHNRKPPVSCANKQQHPNEPGEGRRAVAINPADLLGIPGVRAASTAGPDAEQHSHFPLFSGGDVFCVTAEMDLDSHSAIKRGQNLPLCRPTFLS